MSSQDVERGKQTNSIQTNHYDGAKIRKWLSTFLCSPNLVLLKIGNLTLYTTVSDTLAQADCWLATLLAFLEPQTLWDFDVIKKSHPWAAHPQRGKAG